MDFLSVVLLSAGFSDTGVRTDLRSLLSGSSDSPPTHVSALLSLCVILYQEAHLQGLVHVSLKIIQSVSCSKTQHT